MRHGEAPRRRRCRRRRRAAGSASAWASAASRVATAPPGIGLRARAERPRVRRGPSSWARAARPPSAPPQAARRQSTHPRQRRPTRRPPTSRARARAGPADAGARLWRRRPAGGAPAARRRGQGDRGARGRRPCRRAPRPRGSSESGAGARAHRAELAGDALLGARGGARVTAASARRRVCWRAREWRARRDCGGMRITRTDGAVARRRAPAAASKAIDGSSANGATRTRDTRVVRHTRLAAGIDRAQARRDALVGRLDSAVLLYGKREPRDARRRARAPRKPHKKSRASITIAHRVAYANDTSWSSAPGSRPCADGAQGQGQGSRLARSSGYDTTHVNACEPSAGTHSSRGHQRTRSDRPHTIEPDHRRGNAAFAM